MMASQAETLITLLQQEIANRTRKTLDIHLDDIQAVSKVQLYRFGCCS